MLIEAARRLAPNGRDFASGLRSLGPTRLPAAAHAKFRPAIAAVIDADGSHHASEIDGALEASEAIDRMPTCSDA